ncbi:MAG: dihydrofolate reductase [Pirellulaceae bacterium]
MRISLIVAMSENRVIGRNGTLPWRLADDLRRFKQRTMGHHILMGRKTFESIDRLLPGRTSVVISRQKELDAGGALTAASLDEALQRAAHDEEVFVIGGAEVYQLALPRVHRLYVTTVHAHIDGDRWFPEFPEEAWQVVETSHHPADVNNAYDHTFRILDHRPGRDT